MIKTRKELLEEIYNETHRALLNSKIVIESLKDLPDEAVIVEHPYRPELSKTKAKMVKEHKQEIANAEIKLKAIKSFIDKEGGDNHVD